MDERWGVKIHPLNLGSMTLKHTVKQEVSDTPPPKFMGVNLHTPNLGGFLEREELGP